MTRGALIFAFNNDTINYLKLAAWTAGNIKRHLDIPVAVVTDIEVKDTVFDHVVFARKQDGNGRFFSDFNGAVPWHNQNRSDAYDLSPWDETLVLDADYIVASDQLKCIFNTQQTFLAHRWAYDITGLNDFSNLNYFGRNDMHMWWATVMFFRRNQSVKMIFDSMRMVRDNWRHYRELYGNRQPTFRNDHALSIAINLVNGHVQPQGIPWSMASLVPDHRLTQISQDVYRIDFVNGENKNRYVTISNQDFHAMGKRDLGDIVANQI